MQSSGNTLMNSSFGIMQDCIFSVISNGGGSGKPGAIYVHDGSKRQCIKTLGHPERFTLGIFMNSHPVKR
jgi:hypothetical protein